MWHHAGWCYSMVHWLPEDERNYNYRRYALGMLEIYVCFLKHKDLITLDHTNAVNPCFFSYSVWRPFSERQDHCLWSWWPEDWMGWLWLYVLTNSFVLFVSTLNVNHNFSMHLNTYQVQCQLMYQQLEGPREVGFSTQLVEAVRNGMYF